MTPSSEPSVAPSTRAAELPKLAARPADKTSLADELSALDAAREALGSGDASGALRRSTSTTRRFPRATLGPEATMLRIEALVARGERAAAERVGKAFVEAHPKSPYEGRIRSLLGAGTAAP